jgi:uncharacterized Zn finger protein (UPF0148 family)
MSDFDKEAEREKLRERFEEDRKEREATQRMSDLLLKGATMTNKHCDQCGSPVFRQNGEQFCPSCQQDPDAGSAEAAADDGQAGEQQPDETGADQQQPGAGQPEEGRSESDVRRQQGQSGQGETRRDRTADRRTGQSRTPAAGDESSAPRAHPGDGRRAERRAAADEPGTDSNRSGQPRRSSGSGTRDELPASGLPGEGSPLADARESLVEALVTHARLASDTTDPHRARDHLEAAREAAGALKQLPGR